MSRPSNRLLAVALAVTALGLLVLAAGATAATVALRCGGPGKRIAAAESTPATCAAQPGVARTVEGVLRNDRSKPVAGKVAITYSNWLPQGEGTFDVTPYRTVEIRADAAGRFSIPVKTTSETTVYVEAMADEGLEVSPVTTEANVQLQLSVKVKKLGGGRVRVTVKGTRTPLEIAITEESGYEVSGGAARKARNGVAVFNLGNQHGTYGIYVDAGELTGLFWLETPSFKL
jgi:hypothetical protein